MIRWKALIISNLLNANEAKEFGIYSVGLGLTQVDTVETTTRLPLSRHLMISVPHSVPRILAFFPRSGWFPTVHSSRRNTSNLSELKSKIEIALKVRNSLLLTCSWNHYITSLSRQFKSPPKITLMDWSVRTSSSKHWFICVIRSSANSPVLSKCVLSNLSLTCPMWA